MSGFDSNPFADPEAGLVVSDPPRLMALTDDGCKQFSPRRLFVLFRI